MASAHAGDWARRFDSIDSCHRCEKPSDMGTFAPMNFKIEEFPISTTTTVPVLRSLNAPGESAQTSKTAAKKNAEAR
jgi:hypothetical protein